VASDSSTPNSAAADTGESKPATATDNLAKSDLRSRKAALEREEIVKALDKNRWNKTQTADFLNMSRRSLLYKIKEYGIS
jgi:DNA-binding NtrC family response regulator